MENNFEETPITIESPIRVFIKINSNYEIIDIRSEEFIDINSDWIYIDEGYGYKYRLAQGNYFDKPLINGNGEYIYRFINGKIIEK